MGRSYGDSSLAASVIDVGYLNHLLDFDSAAGEICCEPGVTLAELLHFLVPRGWFLPVTPGTKFITVGGAIASDIHGKNHHLEGSFAEHLKSLRLMLSTGKVLNCSPHENEELFWATCGGMGLTGVIVDATFALKPIRSAFINETIFKAADLRQALELFEAYHHYTYSVAWIDCLATGPSLGRSVVMLGEHAEDGRLTPAKDSKMMVPLDMPNLLLNPLSIKAFNYLYYNRLRQQRIDCTVHYEPFFYPLDKVQDWNRLYGKQGFTQYQFVLPKEAGREGMSAILKRVAQSRRASFLTVLKVFGQGNRGYLSFPVEGYTLAMDFKMDRELLPLLEEIDRIVLSYGGRIYLTKDARMSEATFKQSYPRWQDFLRVRQQHGADEVFQSLQSKRLGI